MELRTLTMQTNMEQRSEDEAPKIEGYFAVYDGVYEIAPGMSESIAPGAFSDSLTGDVRMLTDHNTNLVIGRTTAHTMELRDDNHGLWASALVNPKDQSAMDTWARVERGDVSQASIGFEILDEETELRDDGSVHWTIRKAKLWEVSVCTFPAYQTTAVQARTAQREELQNRKVQAWREQMKERLKDGTESNHAAQKD